MAAQRQTMPNGTRPLPHARSRNGFSSSSFHAALMSGLMSCRRTTLAAPIPSRECTWPGCKRREGLRARPLPRRDRQSEARRCEPDSACAMLVERARARRNQTARRVNGRATKCDIGCRSRWRRLCSASDPLERRQTMRTGRGSTGRFAPVSRRGGRRFVRAAIMRGAAHSGAGA